jgi:hypothetical protein
MEQSPPWEASSGLRSANQKNSLHFMEPEGSLLCAQEPATGPYSEPDESNPRNQSLFSWYQFY